MFFGIIVEYSLVGIIFRIWSYQASTKITTIEIFPESYYLFNVSDSLYRGVGSGARSYWRKGGKWFGTITGYTCLKFE